MENGHIPRTVLAQNMTGTSRPLSALCKHKSKSFGSNSSPRDLKSRGMLCSGRLWIFFVLGSVQFIIGVVITGLYFNIRELTTTLEYAEVLPTYVPAAAMVLSGFCVWLLFWKRLKILVVLAIVACLTTALLETVAATLTGTHVIQVMQTLSQCRYYSARRVCHCTSPYTRSNLNLQYSDNSAEFMAYIFEDADNCESIHSTLLQLVYGLCAGYVMGVFMCIAAAILSGLALRMQVTQDKVEKDTYEEVYSVSGGSSIASDSDNEQPVHQRALAPPPSVQVRTVLEERDPPNTALRRSHSLVQERDPRLEESTDNLLTDTSIDSSAAAGRIRQKRRRHKRAMTLHNLDSKQLMLILSLQMRYLQETENLRDQQMHSQPSGGRHAPNPNRGQMPNPQFQRAPSAPPSQNVYHGERRTPNPDSGHRVNSPSSYNLLPPGNSSEQSLPNTRLEAAADVEGNIHDIPRYVSLPKLPRRSQTPQATSKNHGPPQVISPRIPSSTSDPNIIQHLSPDSMPSKTDMLVQRQGRQKSPPGQDYLPSPRNHHGNQPLPGRELQMFQSYPTRHKTADGNYAQVSSYHRSRTPSASSMTSNQGSRPLPPLRSVSCDNTLQRSQENVPRDTRARQPSNYAEVTYASRSPGGAAGGTRREDLYARPSKSSQILLNDTYVDLYPVQENSQRLAQRSLPAAPTTPPPPPPYPAFFPPVTDLPHRNRRFTMEKLAHTGPRDPAHNDAIYGQLNAPRSHTPGRQTYPQGHESAAYPQGLPDAQCPPEGCPSTPNSQASNYLAQLSQAVYDTSGAMQQQQQRQQHKYERARDPRGGVVSPSNSFRPIDPSVHDRQSPPVREHRGQQRALVLHNSDEDSDEFMETVI